MRRRGAREGALGVALGLAAGALLAACGSSGPPAARRATRSPGRARSRSTTGSTAAPSPSSTAPASGEPACSSGVLTLREGPVSAAAGTSHLRFLLTNEGPHRCVLDGYPAVTLYGGSGAGGAGAGTNLGYRPVHRGPAPGRVVLSGGRAAAFVLSGGRAAAFVLSVSEVPVNGVGCERVASLEVIPPGGAGALSVPAGFEACGRTVGVYALTAPPSPGGP